MTEALRGRAYDDNALPINSNQTISQPFIVARMSELLEIDKQSRVLEIGRRLRISNRDTSGGWHRKSMRSNVLEN